MFNVWGPIIDEAGGEDHKEEGDRPLQNGPPKGKQPTEPHRLGDPLAQRFPYENQGDGHDHKCGCPGCEQDGRERSIP